MNSTAIAALFALAAAPALAAPVTIDFEPLPTQNFPNGQVFEGVEFRNPAATPAPQIRIFDDPVRTSYLLACDLSVGGNPCEFPLEVIFAGPVNALSFNVVAEDAPGFAGSVEYFTTGGSGMVDIFLDGDANTKEAVNLAAIMDITRLVITPDDVAGLGYDDFTFRTSEVPVPPALALMATALGGLGLLRRRRGA
jgi:hypothetical protein